MPRTNKKSRAASRREAVKKEARIKAEMVDVQVPDHCSSMPVLVTQAVPATPTYGTYGTFRSSYESQANTVLTDADGKRARYPFLKTSLSAYTPNPMQSMMSTFRVQIAPQPVQQTELMITDIHQNRTVQDSLDNAGTSTEYQQSNNTSQPESEVKHSRVWKYDVNTNAHQNIVKQC